MEEIRSCWQSEEGRLTPELRSQQLGEPARMLQPMAWLARLQRHSGTCWVLGQRPYAGARCHCTAYAQPVGAAAQRFRTWDANTDTRDRATRLLDTDDEVPSLTAGYGPDGQSVQGATPGYCPLPDREIMRRVLLRGEAFVNWNRVCDNVKLKPDGSNHALEKEVSFRRNVSIEVVHKALSQHHVAVFGRGAGRERAPSIRLRLLASHDAHAIARCHNFVMQCWCIIYAEVLKAIKQRDERCGLSVRASPRPTAGQAQLDQRLPASGHGPHDVRLRGLGAARPGEGSGIPLPEETQRQAHAAPGTPTVPVDAQVEPMDAHTTVAGEPMQPKAVASNSDGPALSSTHLRPCGTLISECMEVVVKPGPASGPPVKDLETHLHGSNVGLPSMRPQARAPTWPVPSPRHGDRKARHARHREGMRACSCRWMVGRRHATCQSGVIDGVVQIYTSRNYAPVAAKRFRGARNSSHQQWLAYQY